MPDQTEGLKDIELVLRKDLKTSSPFPLTSGISTVTLVPFKRILRSLRQIDMGPEYRQAHEIESASPVARTDWHFSS